MSYIYNEASKVLNSNKENPVTYNKLQEMMRSDMSCEQQKKAVLFVSGFSKKQTLVAFDGLLESQYPSTSIHP